jgi:hypothetical protein
VQRYFIHVWNGSGLVEDEEGQELPTPDAAMKVAVDSVRSIVSEDARQGLIDLNGRARIADEQGETVGELAYRDAFDLRLDGGAT